MRKYRGVPVIKSNRLIALLDLIKGTSLNGFAAFPYFILIRGGLAEREDKVIHHEWVHKEQIKKHGSFVWRWKYITDPEFKAQQEREAGPTR